MVTEPGAMPLTVPGGVAIDALPEALLLQTPPPTESVSNMESPTQTAESPPITDGLATTLTTWLAAHPPAV